MSLKELVSASFFLFKNYRNCLCFSEWRVSIFNFPFLFVLYNLLSMSLDTSSALLSDFSI